MKLCDSKHTIKQSIAFHFKCWAARELIQKGDAQQVIVDPNARVNMAHPFNLIEGHDMTQAI
jgi:hypothetical protein